MPKLSQDRRYTPSVDITEDHDAEGRAAPLAYATELVHRVCCVAASGDYVDELRSEHRELRSAIASRETPALFNWLMFAFSHQGVSDRVTRQYIDDHGSITWLEIESAIAASPPCPKLDGYWTFHGCGYHKTSRTCAEPEHSSMCPLPGHELRNGRLNQTAYSLYFFMRDVARNDLVGWIDDQLAEVDLGAKSFLCRPDRPNACGDLGPASKRLWRFGQGALHGALGDVHGGTAFEDVMETARGQHDRDRHARA